MRRSHPRIATFGEGTLPPLQWPFVEMTMRMLRGPGRTIWINDDLVDDGVIQALTPMEFLDLFQEAVLGKADDDNPFSQYISFEKPDGEVDE